MWLVVARDNAGKFKRLGSGETPIMAMIDSWARLGEIEIGGKLEGLLDIRIIRVDEKERDDG